MLPECQCSILYHSELGAKHAPQGIYHQGNEEIAIVTVHGASASSQLETRSYSIASFISMYIKYSKSLNTDSKHSVNSQKIDIQGDTQIDDLQ